MINWVWLVGKFISAVASWLDASNLRNRVYRLEHHNEIMYTALEDIIRLDSDLVKSHAKRILSVIDDENTR